MKDPLFFDAMDIVENGDSLSQRKVVVPDGMMEAVLAVLPETMRVSLSSDTRWPGMNACLVAALNWLRENPIVPTENQLLNLRGDSPCDNQKDHQQWIITEWQRRAFLAPEIGPLAKHIIQNLRGHTLTYAEADEIAKHLGYVIRNADWLKSTS
jgi:hypothetical protein